MPGFDEAHVLALAALASSDGGQDPVDGAIRSAASGKPVSDAPKMIKFVPFDPATKMSEATATDSTGKPATCREGRLCRGHRPCAAVADCDGRGKRTRSKGFQSAGGRGRKRDGDEARGTHRAQRPASPGLGGARHRIARIGRAHRDGDGRRAGDRGHRGEGGGARWRHLSARADPDAVHPEQFAVFAGVLPEDKYKLVKAFQKGGHTVGMCGDGANDAPALRQAQIGIAVSTATDVAKSAAGMVLTEPGLAGIVAAVKEGRMTFQRILTYTLNSITKKIVQVLFLAVGLIMTGQAILTPLLMVLIMITGDFLGMSLTTDNVRPSPMPNAWRIGNLTVAGVIMGFGELVFCTSVLAFGAYRLGFDISALRTLAFVVIVFGNQATTYTNRERRHLWSSRPSFWLVRFVRRRSPDRLDVGHRRNCNDALAGLDRGRHACRGGWLSPSSWIW